MTASLLADTFEEFEFLEGDDRISMLVDLGRALEPMPDALKTDETKVIGCSASVWTYPIVRPDGRLHFLADSNSGLTKGIIALVLLAVQDKMPAEIMKIDILRELEPFHLTKHLTSRRTQGVPNMIKLIYDTATRYVG